MDIVQDVSIGTLQNILVSEGFFFFNCKCEMQSSTLKPNENREEKIFTLVL